MSGAANNAPVQERHAGVRVAFAGFVLVIFILGPVLILAGVVPYHYRYWLLAIVFAAAAIYLLARRTKLRALGFRRDTLKASLRANLWITGVALALIGILYFSNLLPPVIVPKWRWFFLVYLLVSCPLQELLFRGALFVEMERAGIQRRAWKVGVSALLYCFPHSIYHSPWALGVTFGIGIVWGLEFAAHRNLAGVILSHCILGTVSLFSGLI